MIDLKRLLFVLSLMVGSASQLMAQCAGNCGGAAGGCACDDACWLFGDCCPDMCAACPGQGPETIANCGGGGGGGGGGATAGDCPDAINICTSPSFQVDPNGFGNVNELPGSGSISNPSTNPNCCNSGCLLAGELNSTWLIIDIVSNGTLEFSFGAPGGFACYDWAMWENTNGQACTAIPGNTLPPTACNWNGACGGFTGMGSPVPAGGDPTDFEQEMNVVAGQSFVILFSNYSSLSTMVPVNFFGTATVACVTVNNETICVGECATLTAVSAGATGYSWAASPDLNTTVGPVVDACPPSAGTYTYTVTATGTFGSSSNTGTVTVLPANDPACGTPCAIQGITTTVSACDITNNTFNLSGSISFTNPPAGGTLTITDCSGASQTFNAPFVSPINYALNGLQSDGAACSVTAVFSADATCTFTSNFNNQTPCLCSITALTAGPGGCDVATNTYEVSGSISFVNAPASGNLTVTTCTGATQVFNAPFASPLNYTIAGLPTGGGACNVQAVFSANPTCSSTQPYAVPASCLCNVTVGTPATICPGDCFQIEASGADLYEWVPLAGIVDITNPIQNVCPIVTTTYDVTGFTQLPNQVVNGDFSGGNVGFTSGYTFNADTQAEGTYFVANNASISHPGFVGVDHTTGAGNFMIINGSSTAGLSVWCQTVSVFPNTDYSFATWVSTLAIGNPAELQFSINGVPLGATFTAPATTGTWLEFSAIWNSGAATTADICIINQNIALGGNDFGLDDITFTSLCSATGSVTITVSPQVTPTINPAGPFCENNPSGLLAANPLGGVWSATCGACVDALGSFNPTVAGVGTHTVAYTIPGNCGGSASIDIIVIANADATITPVAAMCTSDPSVVMTAVQGGGTWSANCGACINAATGLFNPAVAGDGTWVVTYAISGACGDTQTQNVVVSDQLNATITPVGPFCSNNPTIVLNGADAGGVWSATCGACVNASTGEFSPSVAGAGIHTITYTHGGSCGDQQTLNITINPITDATVLPAGPFCLGFGNTNITALNAGGTWSASCGACIDPATGTFNTGVANIGVHTITYNIGGPCPDQQSITVEVTPNADPSFTLVASICDNQSPVQFTAVTGGGTWSATCGPCITPGGFFNPAAASAGVHDITYTIPGVCGGASIQQVTVNPSPIVSFEVDEPTGCFPHQVNFTDVSSEPGVSFAWNFGDNTNETTALNSASHAYTIPGCYDVTLTVTTANGCSNTATVAQMVCAFNWAESVFSFSPEAADILNPVVSFQNESVNASSYTWFFDSLGTSSEVNPQFTFSSTSGGSYQICLEANNLNGCHDTTCQIVIVNDIFLIYVPNAFTPDGDGKNDVFLPIVNGADPSRYHFMIFNRWGEMIYETKQPETGWDGNFNNDQSPDGVYVWKIVLRDAVSGERRQFTGHVTLLR